MVPRMSRKLLSLVFLATVSQFAVADSVTLSTRFDPASSPAGGDYRNQWNIDAATPATPGLCDNVGVAIWNLASYITNQTTCGGGWSDLDYHFQATFDLATASSVEIQLGADLGHGGAAYVDDVLQQTLTADIYDPTFDTPGQFFDITLALGAGLHTVDLYGLENCCDGPSAGQFSTDGGQTFQSFSTTPTPEPLTLLLTGSGLLGLGRKLRRSR